MTPRIIRHHPAAPSHEASDEPVYTEEAKRQMVEKLRDLGYE